MFKKKVSIKISNYFEIIKPKYIYLKLIPHSSIRNYDSSNIAKSIQSMYKTINQRIKKVEKKYFIETQVKCSYFIDITKDNTSFYFIVPEQYATLIKDKILQTWSQITIEEVKEVKSFSQDVLKYQLNYKKEDALSLNINKKSNTPLNQILNVLDILKDDDRIGIFYNFMPCCQLSWKKNYNETLNKFKRNLPLEREKRSSAFIIKTIFTYALEFMQMLTESILDFIGGEIKKDNKETLLELATCLLNSNKKLSTHTLNKKEATILNTQILVLSDSTEIIRKRNNIISIMESYNSISEDNELSYRKISKKHIFNATDFKIARVEENRISTEECHNFIQLPARDLLEKYSCIQHRNILENQLSQELQNGYIKLGENDYKGNKKLAYMSSDKNLANLGLVVMGPQGSGKSEYFKNYASDVIKAGENLIVLDFIKNCELSSDIETVVPKEKLLIIDMSKEQDLQGFGYNEIKFKENMTEFEILETANLIAQQDMALIDAINSDGAPLTSRMRRYLSAAANIVHLKENKSLRDVINALQYPATRDKLYEETPENLKKFLEDEIKALDELNEVKEIKDPTTKEVKTLRFSNKDSKIEHILDRINLLKEDFKLKFMFNKSLENNIDFVEQLEQGKVILIKIPEHKYPLKYVKNVIVTYFTTKIWLASQIRGKIHDKPLRTHVLLDEIFQAPTSENMLKDILPQCRKFQLKFIISAHYLSQIETIRESLKASGASYMLLQGTDKKNYKELEEELQPFQLEDLLNLKRYSSLNLIKTTNGYARFITKLPAPIR
ncbi:hypothetical protein [Clostridium haemolyticum]|uniref:ATP-binding protein n=1 Tax=Clostridium haemolyticum NCTC 9693 TaxID=1443114 RepID=A0ABR4TGU4_CLOHA|nr:hypothetical protein [Clostridium haemolyticum]KEI18234.1 hypothetical protein Z960_03665 [Clostridium haemolyticum NCTC 9693]KGN03867.1 hypothetical protein Z961_06070 [Clostridium haemolyticum NCTC 8350]